MNFLRRHRMMVVHVEAPTPIEPTS